MRKAIFPGWTQVGIAMLVQAASSAAVFIVFSIVATAMQAAFEPSRTFLMLPITAVVLVTGIINPLLGPAVDSYSLRRLMLIGSLLLAAGFGVLSYATNMVQVVIVYALFFATATVLLGPLVASALLVRWFHRRRGLAMGIAASGTAIGGLLVPPLLQGLIDAFEWRVAFRLFAGLLFLITIPPVLLFTINRPGDRNLHPDGASEPPVRAEGAQAHAAFASTAGVLRNPNFWFIAAVIGSIFAGATAMSSNLLPMVLEKGITAEQGALLLSLTAAGNFCGKLIFAGAGDRLNLRLALLAGLILQALSVFGFLQLQLFPALLAASFTLGLASGAVLPLWGFLIARVFGPDNLGRVMGLMGSVVTCFNFSAPLLYGFAFDRAGSYTPALTGQIIFLVGAMALLPFVRTETTAQPAARPAI